MKNDTLKGFCALVVTIVTLLVFSTNHASAFEVITGSVTEISGPDDLNLDPDKAIIAVDVFGDSDRSVNGVTFFTDRADRGDGVVSEGKVQSGDVSVTTTAVNQIDNWAGAQSFTGGSEGSAANLAEIMRDIRWTPAPNALDVTIEGLTAESIYTVQLLFNENGDRDRRFDISVNGDLAVDNFSSEGGDGTWTNANSFSYNVNATATAEGTIAVSLQNNIGGADFSGTDGNPILQAVIVSTVTPPASLIGFYTFDDAANPNADSSGQGNDISGTTGTAPTWGADIGFAGSGAYDFAGGNLNVPININASELPDMTWGAWVRTDSIDAGLRKVMGHDNGGWDRTIGLDNRNGSFRYTSFTGFGRPVINLPGPANTEDWTFLAAAYDSAASTVTVHVDITASTTDDSLVSVTEEARWNNGQNTFAIGGLRPDNTAEAWDGAIDNVFVYDGILTDAELQALRNYTPEIQIQPIVDIDLTDAELGELATITNTGSLDGDFTAEVDTPSVTEVDGVKAVTLDGTNDWYVGPTSPLTGNADRTVETWVFNPDIPGEETIVAWGRRGGPDSTNWSMNYGNHNTWGALGGWGGSADMAFVAGQTGGPEAGKWHHLALTYDKATNTRSIYVDGFLSNSENNDPVLNTWGVANDPDATPLPIVIGNQNEPNGTRVDALSGSLSIAKLKIYDQALDASTLFNSFDDDRSTFGLGGPLFASFDAESSAITSGESTTISWNILGADSISIDNGVGDVSGTTSVSVSPTESTTYTITATDADGVEKTASVSVNVTQPAPSSAVVIHQWKFEEEGGAGTTLVDSIGGADGTIVDVGGNDGTVGGGSVTLAGGGKNDSDYVKLPSGLVSSLSSASIETWVTQKSAQNWSRVFSVGSASSNVMHMSFTKGGNLNENEWRWNAQSNLTLANFGGQPTNPIDEQVHWVVTVDDTGGADNKTKVTIYKNGEEVSSGDTDNDLSGLNDRDFFLGRSQWGDNAANASWEEFRIYNGALTAEQVTYNNAVGPDGDLPLPAVVAYYDFEGQEGNTVADKGPNGLTADINRADQISIGGSGAPKGSTPGTGADFQGGFLNIPGISVEGIVNDVEGQNSYTLAAWIKPSDINGDKFLFGQTNQGIHNGIRNGGFLHQAHWGADTNGATRLTVNEWVHATFVYDGATDIGTIYLNGEVDWTGQKNKPQGGGNLIVGGRNNGEANYRGIVDDVAVWNEVLTASQVASLAGGQSPINRISLDDDGDGITDSLELALVGNTTDLGAGPGSKGVSFNSDRGNAEATMDAETVAGVVPSTGWVSTDGGADAQGGANGSITNGFTVDWSSNGTWNTNNGGDNGDNKLMNGYIDAIGGGGAAQVKISGINSAFADGYDLYVYFGSDGNNRTGKVALEGGATYSFNTFSAQGGDFPAQYTQTTDEADGNPPSNYAVYKGLTGDAQTVDLIRGSSNSGFHGVQIVGTTVGDYDGDGLTDVAELEGSTSPIDADSDDDGLNDGQEIALGTNPNLADSDNDGVSDGEEIALGTDPANGDSDGDGFKDGDEVAEGSDPALADSIPPFPTPIAYYDFEGQSTASADRSFNGNTATVSGNISFVDEGAPDGYSPGSAAKMEGGHFRVPGIDINSQIRDSGTGSYTMTAWIKPDSLDGERFIFGQTNQGIHNGIRNNAFLHQAHWGADTNGRTNLNDLIPYRLGTSTSNYPGGEAPAKAIDGDGGTKYLNFARLNTGIIVTPAEASVVKSIALSTANDAVERDPTSVAIYGTNDAITSEENSLGGAEDWTLIDSVSVELPDTRNTAGTVVNFDNDTEYTSYKIVFPTVKGNGNSMQIAEIQLFNSTNFNGVLPYEHMMRFHKLLAPDNAVVGIHADPPVGDPDGWIHAAFVYDGATDTGSIYLNGVLDWEGGKRAQNGGGHLIIGGRNNGERNYTGLIDEVTVYTEPLAAPEVAALATGGSPIVSLPDEDGDGFLDAWELQYSTNLDSLGSSGDPSLLAYLNFDNQAEDQSGNGLNGTLNGPAAFSADAEGFSGAAGDYAINLGGVNDKSAVIIENATLDSALNNNTMAVSFWQNTTQTGNTSSFWIHSPSAGANERGFQAHVPWGNGTIYFDQSGCCNGNQRVTVGGKVILDQWQHFVFQRNADGNQEIWVDGEKVAEGGGTAEALEAFTKITIGAEGNSLNNSMAGRLDEFAVWNRMLTAEDIATLSGGAATTEILRVGDFDGDGISDAAEYASLASNPTKADSDDDGLLDGQEIALGTQPLIADTDGDGILDGAEGTAGTDPLKSDTDGDGYADGDEIKTGADPLDADSTPPNLVAYFNFERSSGSSVVDLSAWGNDATVVRPDQTVVGIEGGAPNGPSPGTAADFQGGYLNLPGVDMSKVISGEGSYTLAAWIKPSNLDGNKFLFGQSSQGIHNGIRNGGFLHQAHWGADTNGATNLKDYDASANDGWVHAVWVYDGATDTGKIYLDGVEDYSGDKRAPNGSGNLIVGGSNGGGDNFRGLVDEIAVWNVAAGAEYIAKLAAGQSPLDDNSDGLPDTWAAGFGVTDPDADADEDGIANADEFLLGTDPTNVDSDGDGLNDGDEITQGFDPADSRSLPLPAAIAYYNFEGDSDSLVIDRTFNGNNATVGKAAQTTLGVEGGAPGGASPGKAADLQDGLLRTPIDATPIIEGNGSYTFTAWIKPSDLGGDKFLFGQTSQGIHNGIRNGGFLHQAHWGADTNGATNLNGYLADDEDGWVHAAWTYDAATDTGKIYLDGKLDWEGNKRAPQGSGQIIIGGRNGGEAGYRGLVDEIAIWDVALQAGNIANIADGQAPASTTDADGDGIADSWENLYAGNLTDLGGDADPAYGTSVNNALTAANSGISADNTYTHAISGGGAETVNGVDFELLDGNTTPTNFSWDVSSEKRQINDNNGGWDVGASGVTDAGLLGLLGSFTFNTDGAVGSNQTFTLSGLTPGEDYQLTLFARKWANDTQRQQTVEFTTGGETGSLSFSEDHPELAPIGAATRDTAYSISQVYRAGDDGTANIKFTVTDDDVQGSPGSFHMYGLTNHVVPGGPADLDGDGLSDAAEFASATDPTKADSDDDGLTDPQEIEAGTQALVADTDGDGLNDGDEITAGTNPLDSDSDADGYADGTEIRVGSDPTDSNSVPPSLLAYFDFEGAEDIIVYDIPAGTEGGQEFGGALGMDFDTSGELTVTALGAFDSGSDGLNRDINVQLWSRADGAGVEVLASADFTGDDPGTLEGGQRFKALADPVTLPAGSYTIVASGYGAGEPNINVGVAAAEGLSTNDAGGAITFVGGSRWGDAGAFPANVDGGPAQRYGAGTLKVAAPVSDTVADRGEWGNDATVGRPDQTTLGVEGGAPNGPSPATAVELNDGLLRVPGVDLSKVISGEGSYTFSAWIKPTNLDGDKFFFGQTSQGIHNGIRSGGFLHQAHWGADNNGATNLKDYDASANDGWVHAAFVYDGAADLGQIYLDGVLDWEGAKRAPNGSGTLIIGGRNGGGNGYVGLIDEVAVWDVARSADDIAYLAEGGSPLIDINSDADGDGLTLGQEIEAGTEADNPDTDGDGVNDGVEIANGSDPLDANSIPDGFLPPVTAYYDFEGHEGNTVADKGPNGLGAEINRDDQLTIGGSGAPKGSTPGTGIDLQGGFLNVAGADLSGIINDVEGQNSYTLSAWIKPSDLNGDKFLFGQTSQGIHNGIRGGGFLHQAHWGADNNGATNLGTLDGEWVHAAWTYDGAADVGKIYLNGELDADVSKRAPNGSGNLIIGGRNGGEAGYRGMADDIAVWNQVLDADQIKALAGGQSPINAVPTDEDEDGIPDGYELALVGNITDLGGDTSGKSLGVSFNSNRGNAEATMDADTVAGVFPSTGWISTNGDTDGANGSISNGGLNVDWSSNGTWNTNNGGANGDNKLMNGYIDAVGGEGASQVVLSGINAEFADGYDLYVYFGSDGNDRTGKVQLVDGATYSYNTFSQQGGAFPAQYTRTTDEADGNPQANYALYEGLSGDAQTLNIIRGSNNSGFHGIQIVSPGDYDGDGLSDLAEYEGVTSPLVADGDEDGLSDGAEVAAGTNPNKSDTDGDGLADGDEIAGGTDPTKSDTDDDGYSDGAEIAKGSDPTDANSIPGLPAPIAFYDFEGKSSTALDRSFNDNTATVSGNITFVDEGAPSGSSPSAAASMEGGHFRVPGIDMNSQIRDSGDGSYSMVAWIKPDSLEGERFIFGQTNQGIHNGIRNNAYLHQAHWGADTNGTTNLNTLGLLPIESRSNYPAAEAPAKAIDGDDGTKYLNFARTETGIIVTPQTASTVASISLGTANDAVERDPASFVLYGTNEAIASADNSTGDGEAWTQIASGDVALPDTRNTPGTVVNIENSTEFTSYKLIFPTVKGNGNSMQIAEIQFHTEADAGGENILSPADAILAVHAPSKGENDDEDGWIHAAFVYDGASDVGRIYLDGVLDWEGGKRAPNGGGHLIIGGRNNGERQYTGLIDDVAIWDGVLANAEVAALAAGGSPISSLADEDGDGFLDIWENKYAGNLTDLGSGDADSDFDEDGITDAEEYATQASDPTKADSDDDGLTDGEEFAAGTQPLIADSDGDGLADGAEGTAGTDPLNSDTDGDGYADGIEINVGSDPTDSNSTPPSLLAYYDFEAPSGASITSIEEEGIGGDEPAIIANDFNEDSLTFSDRTHQHNGAAFNADGLLDANGETIVGLPDYLVGGDYIRFANNARENNPYTATVTADKATSWYLLVDNRLDGAAGNKNSPNTTDPVIAGTLQWITDDGWQRVNTGISPNGQADYTGVDEGGDGEGAGQGLNQYYAVYTLNSEKVSVLIGGQGIGGSNMLSLVAKTQTSSTVVADKGTWGNDATVVRPEQTVVGIEGGAPNGPSPGTAADFQGGYLNVPGVDMSKVISGEGSYTLAAWIKPSDLGGNKFLFGQTQQGIHNGIRNGGFLHQAHWGADTNGATNLNDYDASANDGWVHAAWVYDGATDTGKIYLDGVEDYSGDKRAPNGSGNLIVGGSNGGGDNFRGLVDEIAVWDIAAPADVIAALAAGTSPLDIGSSAPSALNVTSFSYNVGTGDLNISWNSEAGKSYGLEYSLDLTTWVDLGQTVESDGDTASFQLPGAQNPLVGQPNVFLRVYER